jgi:hypothetical protein
MEDIQDMGNQPAESSRRKFLTDTAKKAAWVAPALTLMMAASATPARATSQCSGTQQTQQPASGYQFWRVWCQVHRNRSF